MVKIKGTSIRMTRGDTAKIEVEILNQDGTVYAPSETDCIIFTVKERYTSKEAVITKEIPTDSCILELLPDDTKGLHMPCKYVYDVQLIREDGSVDTFIPNAELFITEEVG